MNPRAGRNPRLSNKNARAQDPAGMKSFFGPWLLMIIKVQAIDTPEIKTIVIHPKASFNFDPF